jgi:hypothetical protein
MVSPGYLQGMPRTWILDTDTKGTGARMVPLDSVTQRPSSTERVLKGGKPAPRRPPDPPPVPVPRRFKVVDVMTQQPIVEDGTAREAVDALKNIRSTVDVTVYTWQDHAERWRPLTLGEQGALWELAHPD